MKKSILIISIVFIQIIFIRINLMANNTEDPGNKNSTEITIKINSEDQFIYIYNHGNLLAHFPLEKNDSNLIALFNNIKYSKKDLYRSLSDREFAHLFPDILLEEQVEKKSTYLDSSQSILDYFYKAVKSLTSNPF